MKTQCFVLAVTAALLIPSLATATPNLVTGPFYNDEENIEVCGEEWVGASVESYKCVCANWKAFVHEGWELLDRHVDSFRGWDTVHEDSTFSLVVDYAASPQTQLRYCESEQRHYAYWVSTHVIYYAERNRARNVLCGSYDAGWQTHHDRGYIETTRFFTPADPENTPWACLPAQETEMVHYTTNPAPGDPVCASPYDCVKMEFQRRAYEDGEKCSDECYGEWAN